MGTDEDIAQFVSAIGAIEPSVGSADYAKWKRTFRRSNYFVFNGRLMIVKISRSAKPFWGVGKDIIDLLSDLDDYYLALLISPKEGWLFTKSEVTTHIGSRKWNLRSADNQYKINGPLPDRNSFFSLEKLLEKLQLSK